MEKFTDYHLYLGCDTTLGKLVAIAEDGDFTCRTNEGDLVTGNIHYASDLKLILRSLIDMTEEEREELDKTKAFQRVTPVHHIGVNVWTAESFKWCFAKGFDVFLLIESHLAVNRKDYYTK